MNQKHLITTLSVIALLFFAFSTVYAWQVSITYNSDYNKPWSADSGYHRGQIEWSGGERHVRAGDDYVVWDSFTPESSGYLAMVFHAFQPNSNDCGNIRVGDMGWSWSNLPGVWFSSKGCGWGADNEWRANTNNNIIPHISYYFQHIFRDTSNGNPGTGEINVNSYWVQWYGASGPNHGKFCVNSSGVYAPQWPGGC